MTPNRGSAAAVLMGLAVLAPAMAVEEAKTFRVGMLCVNPVDPQRVVDAFAAEMARSSFVVGKNLVLDVPQVASRRSEVLAKAAEGLVARHADVITTWCGSVGAAAAKQTTASTPIVFNAAAEPVSNGLVAGLARPGANITGFSSRAGDVGAKRLQELVLLKPSIRRVAVVYPAGAESLPWFPGYRLSLESAGQSLSVRLVFVAASTEQDLESAFARLTKDGVDGVFVLSSVLAPTGFTDRAYGLSLQHRLPSIGDTDAQRPSGRALIGSAGNNGGASERQMARLVAKILQGAKPSDIPVEQVDMPGLSVDLRIARVLGITVPPSFLIRAMEVIE